MKPLLILLIGWLLCLSAVGQVLRQENTLRGLPNTLSVNVEDLSADIASSGLRRPQMQIDAELRLRRAGFKIASGVTTNYPQLYIAVRSHLAMGQQD